MKSVHILCSWDVFRRAEFITDVWRCMLLPVIAPYEVSDRINAYIAGSSFVTHRYNLHLVFRPSDHCLSAKLVPTFADRACRVVSVTNPYGRILGLLERSRYSFIQVAPQLHSRGWVDPVPDPLLLSKSGGAGNRTRTFGCVARNSDH
jgi:hypothetical protein